MTRLNQLIGGGSSKEFLIPSQDPAGYLAVPLFIPDNQTNDFSTSANTTIRPGVHYFKDFTINAGHQLTVTGPTFVYFSGTATLGGNGVIGTTAAYNSGDYHSYPTVSSPGIVSQSRSRCRH